jgi:hypothetical protein
VTGGLELLPLGGAPADRNYPEWLCQWGALYGVHEWPSTALLAISGPATGWRADYVPVTQPEAVWEIVQRRHRGAQAYVRVCPTHRARAVGRGPAADSLAAPALWLDVDCAGGQHKAIDLPTRREAGQIVRAVLPPSLIIESGGGVHCYYGLTEPLALSRAGGPIDPESARVLDRWADMWAKAFSASGFTVDAGVSRDPARVLRIAGTTNTKGGSPLPVYVREVRRLQYSVGEILSLCPDTRRVNIIKANRRAVTPSRRTGGSLMRRVERAVSVTTLLSDVWDMAETSDGWTYPRPDGTLADEAHAKVYAAEGLDGVEVVTAFGQRLQRAWGLPDEKHSLRTWDLMVIALGDAAIAEAVTRELISDPGALVEAIAQHVEQERLREQG